MALLGQFLAGCASLPPEVAAELQPPAAGSADHYCAHGTDPDAPQRC